MAFIYIFIRLTIGNCGRKRTLIFFYLMYEEKHQYYECFRIENVMAFIYIFIRLSEADMNT